MRLDGRCYADPIPLRAYRGKVRSLHLAAGYLRGIGGLDTMMKTMHENAARYERVIRMRSWSPRPEHRET